MVIECIDIIVSECGIWIVCCNIEDIQVVIKCVVQVVVRVEVLCNGD